MTEIIKLPLYQMLFFLAMGGVIGYCYYALLYKSLKMMQNYTKKGCFLFISTVLRLTCFIFLTFIFTQFQVGRFIWYILGFMLVRLFAINHLKKGKIHG